VTCTKKRELDLCGHGDIQKYKQKTCKSRKTNPTMQDIYRFRHLGSKVQEKYRKLHPETHPSHKKTGAAWISPTRYEINEIFLLNTAPHDEWWTRENKSPNANTVMMKENSQTHRHALLKFKVKCRHIFYTPARRCCTRLKILFFFETQISFPSRPIMYMCLPAERG